MIWKNKLKSILVVFLFFLTIPIVTKAAGSDNVGIFPAYPDANIPFSDSWFIYKLNLGQEKVDGIRVINSKKDTIVVRLYPVDAETTQDGSFALLPEDAERKDVGSWVKLAVDQIEIPPLTEKTVPFVFTVPKNADAGDHMGGIIMQEVEMDKDLSGTGMKIITRVGVRIYETIPGEIKKDFEITKFDWREYPTGVKNFFKDFLDINKKMWFFVGIKNNGNVQLQPRVTVDVKNMLGITVAHLPDQEIGTIFPRGENAESTVRWDKAPFFGRYTVSMKVNVPDMPEQTRQLVIWKIPYRLIFLIIILGVVIILGRLFLLYFREAAKEKMPIYVVNHGDSLAKLAALFLVKWHKIARVNDLKKPFEIQVGEKLFIPVNRKNKKLLADMIMGGFLLPSISDSTDRTKSKGKVIALAIVVVIIGAAAIYGIKNKKVHQEVPVPEKTTEVAVPQETPEKTSSGAFKKSSVQISIKTLASGDLDSSMRIFKRFELAGYQVNLSPERDAKYAKTTIEYKAGKQAQAEMVRTDLGVNDQIDLIEVSDLGIDAVVYNALDKNNFLAF